MSEESAFKNWINPQVVILLSDEIQAVYPGFNSKKFNLISQKLSDLELKARVRLIAQELKVFLPPQYTEALPIIIRVMERDKLKGFALWPFSEFIGAQGLNHFDESLNAMEILTQKFTAEFCVRPFFLKNPTRVLKAFSKYSKSTNHHVRRWVSEGSRPMLPWGEKIPLFVSDPQLTIPLLESLKYDDELYVRKSVANHLNDYSKHHPLVVIETLKRWMKECPQDHVENTAWITRHALRTLIKKGHPGALKLLGVNQKPLIEIKSFKLDQKKYCVGENINLSVTIRSQTNSKQKLVVDYIIHYMKANGSLSPKVYKWKTFEVKGKEVLPLKKRHSLKKISTLKFYPGAHKISLQINGSVCGTISWSLSTLTK